MAFLITQDCINCDVCSPECPNEAIFLGKEFYEIDENRCTECVGYYEEPQCVMVCPVHCIIKKPASLDTKEVSFKKQKKQQRK